MNIEEKMLTEVVLMNYSSSEEKVMKKLDVIWLKSKDLRHKNVLAYSTNIMVTDINESCPRKFIHEDEFFTYIDEFKNEWLVSESISAYDLDSFFKLYFNLEELVA